VRRIDEPVEMRAFFMSMDLGETVMAKEGRPPYYETPEEMQAAIDDYFNSLTEEERPTVTGMVYALGFNSRHGLDYYAQEKPQFLDTIKKAKLRIEMVLEDTLYRGSSVTGVIFNLKNNFGWKDEQKFEHVGEGGGPLVYQIKWVD